MEIRPIFAGCSQSYLKSHPDIRSDSLAFRVAFAHHVAMTLEYATFNVRPGSEEEFQRTFLATRCALDEAVGVRSASLARCLEHPSRFVLRVDWENVQAHEAFRTTPEFADWRTQVGPFFDGSPEAAHYEVVAPGA
jgi:quinol monooxygenase YgiN